MALVVVQKVSLGLEVWKTLAAILLSIPLMLVGLRVLGETNWGPISPLSNMMQGVFGVSPRDRSWRTCSPAEPPARSRSNPKR